MKWNKKVLSGLMAGLTVAAVLPMTVFAATEHYANGTSVAGASGSFAEWQQGWNEMAADYTKVSLTPGKNETELNFAWYSMVQKGTDSTPVVLWGTDKKNLREVKGTTEAVDSKLTDGVLYVSNHVTAKGLKAQTTYYYTVKRNGRQDEVRSYTTGDFKTTKILYVGDPQIGSSKGQPQGSITLKADKGAANTAACNDSYNWDRTLSLAYSANPDLNFIISAGDQVNRTGKPKEEEYAGYLSADALQYIPVATTIGNHDSLNADYRYHFNNPNTTKNGLTQAGGDYYYSYGEGLFIVLNTNNYNCAEHEQTIKQAVASDPNAKWRVVTFHQDIYGSGLDHSDTDGMILRTQLTPMMDQYDIDVVLQGHDHTYSRSKLLYSDGKTHGSYEFRLDESGSDYDWDNAYHIATSSKIPLIPDKADKTGTAAQKAFAADNNCYTIEGTAGNTVTNPKGTLYMTANSASGSKYYELIASQQDYIAARSQNWLPSYSVIQMTPSSFSIETYQITAEGKTEKIDEPFTISKN